MNWLIKQFSELDTLTFYKLVKARIDIFVLEQNCPYPELDEEGQVKDSAALTALLQKAD